MSHLVHLAAPAIRAANVIRQRCSWCGALLEELDLDAVVFQDDGSGENPIIDPDGNPRGGWAGLVAVEQHGELDILGVVAKWSVDDPTDGKIPEDSCFALPTEVTR